MKNARKLVWVLCCTVAVCRGDVESGKSKVRGADEKKAEMNVGWSGVFPVVISSKATAADRAQADRLAAIFGLSQAGIADTNPVCCFWVEIDGWKPNPGQPGYVVLFQPGGCVLRASNTEQLERAIAAIQSAAKIVDGKRTLPGNGLLTSYPVL
jgi:hypothetical protein